MTPIDEIHEFSKVAILVLMAVTFTYCIVMKIIYDVIPELINALRQKSRIASRLLKSL